jgi:hypothetical protein
VCNRESRGRQRLRSCLPRGEVTTAKALFRLHFCPTGEVAFARPYQNSLFNKSINACTSWVYAVGTGLRRRETEHLRIEFLTWLKLATPIDRIDGYIAEMHRLRLLSLAEISDISVFLRLLLNHLDVCEQS